MFYVIPKGTDLSTALSHFWFRKFEKGGPAVEFAEDHKASTGIEQVVLRVETVYTSQTLDSAIAEAEKEVADK